MVPDGGLLLGLLPGFERLRRFSRRQLLLTASALAAGCRGKTGSPPAPAPRGRALDEKAWAVAEALSARILPAADGPGARRAGVVAFIDAQLASAALGPVKTALLLALELLDSVARTGGAAGFTALPAARQDALLAGLAAGTLPAPNFPQREAFSAFHALTLEGFLGDPVHGGNRDMVAWKWIQFPEPGLRPSAALDPAQIGQPPGSEEATGRAADESFDVCVVGSGAGGGAAAYALCRAGLRVVVLEKGPLLDEGSFVHDEIGVCRRPFFVPHPLHDPNVVVTGGGAGERTGDGWISSCVGGGTVHMAGYFFRMRPEDFRARSLGGEVAGASVADWPIAPAEMDPFYAEAESVLGLSGDSGAAQPGRRRPYPLGPLLSHPAGALVDAACRRSGLQPFRVPRAIVSAEYRGRPACHYCRFCASYGCEVGAKSSTLSTFLALARSTGRLTLRPRTTVVSISAEGGRATGVVIQERDGRRRRIRARVVVLAASAVQSARLLLLSGLANGSGLLGQNLMFVAQAGGWGRFGLPSPHFPAGAGGLPFIDRAVQDRSGTLLFQLPHANPIFQAERLAGEGERPLFGAALERSLRAYFLETRTVEFEAFSEWLPTPGCHVTLDPESKDAQGLPVARLTVDPHPATRATCALLAARGRAVLEAAGATRLGADPPRTPLARAQAYPFLQAGTARMGRKAAESVLDPTGQAHDVRNLYLADGSGFPSGGGAPHTLTIMANALRVAAAIAARARSGSL